MILNHDEFTERISIFSTDMIEPKDRSTIKKLLYLFPSDIYNSIVSNGELYGISFNIDRTPTGVLKKSITNAKNIKDEWLNSKYFRNASDELDRERPDAFIVDYKRYIKETSVYGISELVYFYIRTCEFAKKYIVYRGKVLPEEFCLEEFGKFLQGIVQSYLSEVELIYKYICTPEELFLYKEFTNEFNALLNMPDEKIRTKGFLTQYTKRLIDFYTKYDIPGEYIWGSTRGIDITILLMIHRKSFTDTEKYDIASEISYVTQLYLSSGMVKSYSECSFSESVGDTVVNSNDISGHSDNDITVFGSASMVKSFDSNDSLKMDILKFSPDFVRTYINKSDETKINFIIDEQYLMYLKAELDSQMVKVNTRYGNESNMITILNYENDNFVLFTVDGEDTLYGLSLTDTGEDHERKLITIDKDEDLNFSFVIDKDLED